MIFKPIKNIEEENIKNKSNKCFKIRKKMQKCMWFFMFFFSLEQLFNQSKRHYMLHIQQTIQ